MRAYNPAMQVVFCRDVERVHTGTAPSINLVATAYGRNAAESWMEIQLNNLSEFAGCKEKLNQYQIVELAQMIIDGYPHYKLTDFMLFFQRFKRCEYGKFYGAVDPMIILQALSTFNEQRARKIDEIERQKRKEREHEREEKYEALKQRYIDRVPDAFSPEAAINFTQYRLMGYDNKTDEELAQEIDDIKSGHKTIPKDIQQMLAFVEGAFEITD